MFGKDFLQTSLNYSATYFWQVVYREQVDHIVGKLLGHTQAARTQRYAHLADEPLRQATEIFGGKMERLIAKNENGKNVF